MKKLNNQGSALLVVFVVLVIILAGVTGYLVYRRSGSSNQTATNNADITVTEDSSHEQPMESNGQSIEIAAINIKVNDPEKRGLMLHTQKICAADCDDEDSYFIHDSNTEYFGRCQYPAGIDEVGAEVLEEPESYVAKHTKKIGDRYYYVTPGSNFQSPCGSKQDGDDTYEDNIRQYILDNMVAL